MMQQSPERLQACFANELPTELTLLTWKQLGRLRRFSHLSFGRRRLRRLSRGWLRSGTLGNMVSVLIQPDVSVATWTFQGLHLCSALASASFSEPAWRLFHSRRALV